MTAFATVKIRSAERRLKMIEATIEDAGVIITEDLRSAPKAIAALRLPLAVERRRLGLTAYLPPASKSKRRRKGVGPARKGKK